MLIKRLKKDDGADRSVTRHDLNAVTVRFPLLRYGTERSYEKAKRSFAHRSRPFCRLNGKRSRPSLRRFPRALTNARKNHVHEIQKVPRWRTLCRREGPRPSQNDPSGEKASAAIERRRVRRRRRKRAPDARTLRTRGKRVFISILIFIANSAATSSSATTS